MILITHDPLPVAAGDVGMCIDLGAEKLIAAEKERKKSLLRLKVSWENRQFMISILLSNSLLIINN